MKKLIFLYILFPILLTAQNNKFKLGFGLVSHHLMLSDMNNNVTYKSVLPLPPLHFGINLKYILDENFSLKSKLGFAIGIVDDYNGFEYGISGEYNFNKNYYTSIGFMKHDNNKMGEYAVEANINFINAGFGYNVSKYLSIEAIYFYPLNKELISNGSITYPGLQPNPEYIRRVESMIYLNFDFYWSL